MPEFSAKDVQRLRQKAGVGMMDAKQALVDSGGDDEKAYDLLRERGLAAASKRSDRDAKQGAVGYYLHYQSERPLMGVLVELNCETDFVAKNPEFLEVANDLAMHIAWGKPDWIRREEVPVETIKAEQAILTKQAESKGSPPDKIPQIVEGKMKKFLTDRVLYEQTFVNTDKFEGTVEQYVGKLTTKMAENIQIGKMSRITVGEAEEE